MSPRRLALAAVLGWVAIAVTLVVLRAPLGHDEAAYALEARGDGPEWLYRSSGTIAEARVGILLGGSELALRIASALLGIGFVIGVAFAGARAFGERTGAWAAAVVAASHPMVLRSSELLGDLPAAACLLFGAGVLVGELARERGPTYRLLWAAPALAAAFYVRYGSAPTIGILIAASVIVWWRALLARPWPVVATVALFAVLLVPHVVHSIQLTGRALGILDLSAGVPRNAYFAEGLVTYVASNPFRFYGSIAPLVMLAGLAGLVRPPARARPTFFLGLVAIAQIVTLGLHNHGQPRYIYFATALLIVLGVEALGRLAAARPRFDRPRVALAIVGVAWLGIAASAVPYDHLLERGRAPIVASANAVRTDAAGRPCRVAAIEVPQIEWYSGCLTEHAQADAHDWPADQRRYLVSWPGHELAPTGPTEVIPAADADARVWRLVRP